MHNRSPLLVQLTFFHIHTSPAHRYAHPSKHHLTPPSHRLIIVFLSYTFFFSLARIRFNLKNCQDKDSDLQTTDKQTKAERSTVTFQAEDRRNMVTSKNEHAATLVKYQPLNHHKEQQQQQQQHSLQQRKQQQRGRGTAEGKPCVLDPAAAVMMIKPLNKNGQSQSQSQPQALLSPCSSFGREFDICEFEAHWSMEGDLQEMQQQRSKYQSRRNRRAQSALHSTSNNCDDSADLKPNPVFRSLLTTVFTSLFKRHSKSSGNGGGSYHNDSLMQEEYRRRRFAVRYDEHEGNDMQTDLSAGGRAHGRSSTSFVLSEVGFLNDAFVECDSVEATANTEERNDIVLGNGRKKKKKERRRRAGLFERLRVLS